MDPSLALWAAMLLSFAFSREAAAAVLMRCPSPYGVSTNGQVLAVTAPVHYRVGPDLASRWTRGGGVYFVPEVDDALGHWASGPNAQHEFVRTDETGNSIAFAHGSNEIEDRGQVLHWSASRGTQRLAMYSWWTRMDAIELSRDGSTVAWMVRAGFTNPPTMYRWRASTGVETLTGLMKLLGISRDGKRVFGVVHGDPASLGWIDHDGGLHVVGPVRFEGNPTLRAPISGFALGADGITLLVTVPTGSGNVLMRYRIGSERWELVALPIPGKTLEIAGVTDDQRMVVGVEGWIWTESHGIETLVSYLARHGIRRMDWVGFELEGWELRACRGISGNGRTLLGTAYHPTAGFGYPTIQGWAAFWDPAPVGNPAEVNARRGPAVLLDVAAGLGNQYRIQRSKDLSEWLETGLSFEGKGTVTSFGFPAGSDVSEFYRVHEVP